MITDEMLRTAAARSCELYVNYLERDYNPEYQHEFSPQFEKKIERLKRIANHPVLFHMLNRVASIILAILIFGGIWLAVDVEVRATFFGWVKEIHEMLFAYRFSGEVEPAFENYEYRPTWVPDRYSEYQTVNENGGVTVFYKNETGERLRFSYIYNPNTTEWYIDTSNTTQTSVSVNGQPADLFIAANQETANTIFWTAPTENVAFHVSAFISEDELIRVAESVIIK